MVKKSSGKKATTTTQKVAATVTTPPVSPEVQGDPKHQQRLLDIFSEAFYSVLSADTFPTLIQEIKQALFNRDFSTAFGREDYLEAYAARWSPTRALCYSHVLRGLESHLSPITTAAAGSDKGRSNLQVVSIGGCAAEHVAVASYVSQCSLEGGHITLVDSAPWSQVASLMHARLTMPPELSRYASASAKASNCAFIEPERLSMSFVQKDVLSLDGRTVADLLRLGPGEGRDPLLVTLFFTLNELYTDGGIGKTTSFLTSLGRSLPNGSLLLVLDSPGSYSETALGKEKKRYPMHWLLDHTLLKADDASVKWEKLKSNDSKWFRLPDTLRYPMQLENMRYQMHLYKLERC
ncbi:25S rRNA (uracil2843-N3)-methyltransferase [Geosmithia morbida]|uniref:25S rRNA (Uracil2843-N3)-methyltransferase n=1 Tax=Geosmithia morbida TaxID=1094350 RepID=A0A9P4Z011_9HYPO|nr:25S rRNA (uracil2843-N3)-methyltransferase [Geosmithia morbida]KAF4125667.1 25S rRNA (uracil2843-N3)-methyltransferase [Geosmithia morbida]